MIDIISHLKRDNYDYLPLCKCDGVTNDGPIIQARMNAGLDPFKAESESCNNGFVINKALKLPPNFNLDCSKIG